MFIKTNNTNLLGVSFLPWPKNRGSYRKKRNPKT